MSHPSVVTLDERSVPRVLLFGNQLRPFQLPVGSRVLYPKHVLPCVPDVAAALRHALAHPSETEPLSAKLKPGMRVAVALDAQFVGALQAGANVCAQALDVVLPVLADNGITDIAVLIATGIHRRLTNAELRYLLGPTLFTQQHKFGVQQHDPEGPDTLVRLSSDADPLPVELNRSAAAADLLITIAITGQPRGGGHATTALGLGGYANARRVFGPHLSTDSTHDSADYDARMASVGGIIAEAVPVFSIEFTLDSQHRAPDYPFLRKNEDDLTPQEHLRLRALAAATQRIPVQLSDRMLTRAAPRVGVTGVFAGAPDATHEQALARHYEQHCVPIGQQADVLVAGLGPSGLFNSNAALNPLLVSYMAQSWLFSQYLNMPLVKPGGTLIVLHPFTDRFDHLQHNPYINFVHQLLSETRDGKTLHARYESKFARDPALLEMFRTGHAYHPAHAFMLWYQGEQARRHLARMIVVGADNEYVPKLFGYETALNLDEALYRARNGSTQTQDVLCLHNYPTVMGEVSPRGL